MSRFLLLLLALLIPGATGAEDGVVIEIDGPVLPQPEGSVSRETVLPHPLQVPNSDDQGPPSPFAWSTLLRELADEALPRDFEKLDGWGRQAEVVSGVRVREKNGLPRISKRTKLVNHGAWRKYRIELLNPQEKLRFAIHDVVRAERGGLTCTVVVSARVRCTARSEYWNLGIRTGSATVQADATVRAVARFAVSGREVDPDDDGWLVDVEYVPEVNRVRVELDDFDVRRVGQLDGDLADGLGNTVQPVLAEILEGQAGKATRRIRRELVERDAQFKVTLPRVLVDAKLQSE